MKEVLLSMKNDITLDDLLTTDIESLVIEDDLKSRLLDSINQIKSVPRSFKTIRIYTPELEFLVG